MPRPLQPVHTPRPPHAKQEVNLAVEITLLFGRLSRPPINPLTKFCPNPVGLPVPRQFGQLPDPPHFSQASRELAVGFGVVGNGAGGGGAKTDPDEVAAPHAPQKFSPPESGDPQAVQKLTPLEAILRLCPTFMHLL